MQHLMPHPSSRRTVSSQVRRLITYAWMIASLALPVAGVLLISQGLTSLAPSDPFNHQVRSGETLYSIAIRYGVTVDEIMQANGLANGNYIFVGQNLVIPSRNASGQQVHTVQPGESLNAIARRYGVGLDQLIAANGLADPNNIRAGQQIVIPGAQSAPSQPQQPAAQAAPVLSAERTVTYTMRRGDSLYRVSLIFGVTVDDLLAANRLANPNAVYPGLVIRIPTGPEAVGPDQTSRTPTSSRTHTVAAGDTLTRIALQYGVTVDGLAAANGLSRAENIYVGQVLNLPDSGQTARPAPAAAAVSHRVVRGQSLHEIALRYGVTVHALSAANGITDPSHIYEGQVLSIPSVSANSASVAYASVGPGLCDSADPVGTGTGYFIRPTRGYVITQEYHTWHSGIDLALAIGENVFAADSGTVIYSGWNTVGYGNLVILDHGNGWRTYYAHLSEVFVACGDWISRAAVIGAVGSTGNSTGPHLHFEMLRYGIAVNPSGYIRFP